MEEIREVSTSTEKCLITWYLSNCDGIKRRLPNQAERDTKWLRETSRQVIRNEGVELLVARLANVP